MIMVHHPSPLFSVEGGSSYHRACDDVPELGVSSMWRNDAIPGSAFARSASPAQRDRGEVRRANRLVPRRGREAGAGRFTWVAGLAELHAPGYFAVGATGFTSGLANIDPSTLASPLACPGR